VAGSILGAVRLLPERGSGNRVFQNGESGTLRELDVATYSDFAKAARRGDELSGHEVLQNAWLKSLGYIQKRGVGAASRNNPALAVGKKLHGRIGQAQRDLGLFNPAYLRTLNSTEVVNLNVIALKHAGVDSATIRVIAKEALRHARSLP